MQIPLLAGRTFGPQDTATSHRVSIISETVARDLFPAGVNPIGRHYFLGHDPLPDTDVEVIGLVKDVKFREPAGEEGLHRLRPQRPPSLGIRSARRAL